MLCKTPVSSILSLQTRAATINTQLDPTFYAGARLPPTGKNLVLSGGKNISIISKEQIYKEHTSST